jgi:hypothetical protein
MNVTVWSFFILNLFIMYIVQVLSQGYNHLGLYEVQLFEMLHLHTYAYIC